VRRVADSFAWPFHARSRWTWPIGILTVLFLPVLFIPLLGYAVAATRVAEQDPAPGPPDWHVSGRLLSDGLWASLAVILIALPFALLWNPLSILLGGVFGAFNAHIAALLMLALPWGLLTLLLLPQSTARFASSGRPGDLFDARSALRAIRGDFAAWNAVIAAIVTAWAVGVACVGLLCVGLVPGIFYAILVSAHATAALRRPGPRPAAG
jgi:hypothetical protein